MQDALFSVQKSYAMSGDKELGDLLVDMLVDRAGYPKRNLVQITLDEALTVAPRLTIEQLDVITLSFLFTKTSFSCKNYNDFVKFVAKIIAPFIGGIPCEKSSYQYIEYLGCGHIRSGGFGSIEHLFRKKYNAFFSLGFTLDEIKVKFSDEMKFRHLIMPCIHNSQNFQIKCLNFEALDEVCKQSGFSHDEVKFLRQLFDKTAMPNEKIKDLIIRDIPLMRELCEMWNAFNYPLQRFELTPIGIAIAQANYRRKTNETFELSKWIN